MKQAQRQDGRTRPCEVIDFDQARLAALTGAQRAELIGEAEMLAAAFARDGGPAAIRRMADQLSCGARDAEMERAHARWLAAALKHLANDL